MTVSFGLVISVVVGLALVSTVYAFAVESIERYSQKKFASSMGAKMEKLSSEVWKN